MGYYQQVKIYNFLKNNNLQCIIIDADDVLTDPKKTLIKLCQHINIIFDEKMLKWKKGSHSYDGVWGKYWYQNVSNSTEFNKLRKQNTNIPISYENIYNLSLQYYKKLYKMRLINKV